MLFFKKLYQKLTKLVFAKKTNSITILTYHGLVDAITNPRLQRNFHTIKQFEDHITFLLQKKYNFLNASELLFYIENPLEIKNKKLVCITFDDGYQNNLKAIEILNKYNLSGTFFISSEAINTNKSIWTVNLSLLLLEGNLNEVNLNNEIFSLKNYDEKLIVFNKIRTILKSCNSIERQKMYNKIVEQFAENELERLIIKNDCFKMLTWSEIEKVQSQNIQFQSHGHWHEIHHHNQIESTIDNEIEFSKKAIEEHLNNEVFLFAYPNGNYNPISDKYLLENNYKAALILGEKKYNCNDTIFCIPRITPNGKLDKFKKQLKNN